MANKKFTKNSIISLLSYKVRNITAILICSILLILVMGFELVYIVAPGEIKLIADTFSRTQNPPVPSITPTLAPQPTDILVSQKLPDTTPDKLIISWVKWMGEIIIRPLTKTIADAAKVKELYDDLKLLPLYRPGRYNCPMDTGIRYQLDFYKKDALILHASANPTGCAGVSGPDFWARNAKLPNGKTFLQEIQHILQLSDQDFYGYSRQVNTSLLSPTPSPTPSSR